MSAPATHRVLLADDHPLVLRALSDLIDAEPDLEVVGEARDFHELRARLGELDPDVVVLDIGMPGGDALDVVGRISRDADGPYVLVLSGRPESEFVGPMLKAGAAGYVQKDSEPADLVDAVRRVASGHVVVGPGGARALAESAAGRGRDHEVLSVRELQVLRMLGQGRSVAAIADALFLSPKTVSTYRSRLMTKMGLASGADIIRYAVRRGLVE